MVPAKKISVEETVVGLYFASFGVRYCDVGNLLHHKCYRPANDRTIGERLRRLKRDNDLYDSHARTWKRSQVGKYLKTIMGDSTQFEDLIRFGPEEEALVNQGGPRQVR